MYIDELTRFFSDCCISEYTTLYYYYFKILVSYPKTYYITTKAKVKLLNPYCNKILIFFYKYEMSRK